MSKKNGICEDMEAIYIFGSHIRLNLDDILKDLMYFVDILDNEVVCQQEANECFRIVCLEMGRLFTTLRLLKSVSSKYLTDEEINKYMKNYSVHF